MHELELNKEYYVHSVKKGKFGYICSAVTTFKGDDGKILKRVSKDNVDVRFYANRLLSDYIDDNSVVKFGIKIVSFDIFTRESEGKSFKVPKFEIAIIERDDSDSSSDEEC